MHYFITGASGFLGRNLLKRLIRRPGNIFCLVHDQISEQRLVEIGQKLGLESDRLIPVHGDLRQPGLGLNAESQAVLKGQISHFFHLAAIYDLKADAEIQVSTNVEGTRNAMACAAEIGADCFHHISSIAVAGLYRGAFSEDMLEQAERLNHPYFMTKHLAEKAVRDGCPIPYRIYRPGIVVGDSNTGEADKVDGPYYFFKLLQKIRDNIPKWMPMLGLEGGRLNLVPVNFVTDAMDYLAHQEGLDGRCFHLTDSNPYRCGEVLNLFAKAAHAPPMVLRFNTRLVDLIPPHFVKTISNYPPLREFGQRVLDEYGIPEEMASFFNYPTRFDNRATRELLDAADIRCPDLNDYAEKLWDYWERHLDPDLFVERTLQHKLANKVVLITGASSGIGQATALRLAPSGAKLLMVARDPLRLNAVKAQVEERGGIAQTFTCDLSDEEQSKALIEQVLAEHGGIDLLINNAGRSIRRSVEASTERFHDYERTMAINYFGALRLILGFLPSMAKRRQGHVINISSIGVLTNAPRFSAYVASKSALESFCRCAASEYSDRNIRFTTINMPLVDTPMIAPTKLYDSVPLMSVDEAAEMVIEGVLKQPKRIATRLGIFGAVLHAIAPKLSEIIMNTAYRMFPDSEQLTQESDSRAAARKEQMISLAAMMRGIHF
ncbi:SDR family oxidoreductase [Paraferrimonas sedimenticola]|uniref:Short chain dehydrogenase n=1 Tax=Paraferrimonas sedimenticola TaxID=375674 RepID=A0AA37W041_9GAMM|nr:SDR family oxidoreductase [Paraferrimonas sedimenticola]GLP95890.1 short chain dehydrogenase [Paraferrimonas sedimenticola]